MQNPVDIDTATARTALTALIDEALTPQEVASVVQDAAADESTLIHAIGRIKATTYWGGQDRDLMVYTILASPACTTDCIAELDDYAFRIDKVLRLAVQKGYPLSPVALSYLVNDRWVGRDISTRLSILRHQNVTAEIVKHYAKDNRVTLSREVAKHALLEVEPAEKYVHSADAKTRANVTRQPDLSEESLRLLKHDPSPMVARAAKKAMDARGLADTDGLDAVMEDEVSLFFLAASDDEMTIARLGSSPDSPEETLRTIAGLGGKGRLAVAGNGNAPSDLIEAMSIELSETDSWDYLLGATLAGNPRNTPDGLRCLIQRVSWDRDLLLIALKNPNCPVDIVREKGITYGARNRVAAIATGLVTAEDIDQIMRYESREAVLVAVANYDQTPTELVRLCWTRGGERAQKAALAALAKRGEPFESPIEA